MTVLPWRAVAALLFNATIFGTVWWPFRHIDALGLHSLYATSLAYLLVLIGLLLWRWSALPAFVRHPGLWLLALAAGLTNAAFNWGVVVGDVIRVVLLFYLMPVWAALLGRWLLGEVITAGTAIRIAIALTGAALVLHEPGTGLPVPHGLGDWLGLAGGFWFAMTNILLKRHVATQTEARMMAMFLGGALIPGALALALTNASLIAAPAWPPTWWLATLGLGVLMVVANLCLQYGAGRLPANITAVIMISEVLFAALSAVWLGAGQMTGQIIAGGLLILVASLAAAHAASLEQRRSRRAAVSPRSA